MAESIANENPAADESTSADVRKTPGSGGLSVRKKAAAIVVLVMVGVCTVDFGTQENESTGKDSIADLELFLQDLETAPESAPEEDIEASQVEESAGEFALTIPDNDAFAQSQPVIHSTGFEQTQSDQTQPKARRIRFTGTIQKIR